MSAIISMWGMMMVQDIELLIGFVSSLIVALLEAFMGFYIPVMDTWAHLWCKDDNP